MTDNDTTEKQVPTVWVDADACPVVIKEVLFKAARRTGVQLTLVANQYLQVPKMTNISFVQVPPGFDVADNEIVKRCTAGDLVVTNDIPLAADVIKKGATAVSPRGEHFTKDTIAARLGVRDLMDPLRSTGVEPGGPPPLNQRDRQQFANHLDKYISGLKSS